MGEQGDYISRCVCWGWRWEASHAEGLELFPCILAEDVGRVTTETVEAVQGGEGRTGLFLSKVCGPRDCRVIAGSVRMERVCRGVTAIASDELHDGGKDAFLEEHTKVEESR